MSFLAPKTNLPTGVNDNTPGRQATQSSKEVLPLILGRGRAVVQPVTPVLRWNFRETQRSNFAFATYYGWVCHGPIDEAVQLIVNDKPYQGIFERREDNPGTAYVDMTISKETPERFRVWWGLEDGANYTAFLQSLVDPQRVPAMVGKTHPKHRGICAIAIQDLECGRADGGNTPPLPKVELEVYRRSPRAYSFGHVPHGTHLLCAAWDFLTLKRGGLKIDPALLDKPNWDAKIDQLYNDGLAGISGTDLFGNLVVADAREGIDVLGELLQPIDGHIRERDGKLQVDFMPGDGSTSDPTGLRTISQFEMGTGVDPEEDPDGVEEMPTLVAVTGLDMDANPPMTEVTEVAQVPFARQLLQENRPELPINQPLWCTRRQIKASAQLQAARRAVSEWRGTVPVLKQYAVQPDDVTPLRAGDRFDLDRADIGLDLVVRIVEVNQESATHVVFKVIGERGAFPRPYEPSLDPRADDDAVAPVDLARFAAAQLPADLSDAADTRVAMLVERPALTTIGFETHFSPDDSWPGQVLDAGNTRWAVGAVLQTAMAASLGEVTVNVDGVGTEFGYFESQSALEQADDQLLMWRAGEWMSVGAITSLGGGTYSLGLRRTRLGSWVAAHGVDDVVYLIKRSDLISLTHASFAQVESGGGYDAGVATKYFKVRPYTSVQGNLTGAFSAVLRDPTPDAVSGLAVAMQGRFARLTWTVVAGALVEEYQVYRETWDGDSSSWIADGKVGETTGTDYPDQVPDFGIYRWRVRAVATDYTAGGFSGYESATAAPFAEGEIDNTAPTTPRAPTFDSEGTGLNDDGGARAWVQINLPSLPSGAAALEVLRRETGTTNWHIDEADASAGTTFRVNGLPVGVAHQFAVRARSRFGFPSSVSTVLSRTSPVDATTPSNPTGLASSIDFGTHGYPPAKYLGAGVSKLMSAAWFFPGNPPAKDVDRVEVFYGHGLLPPANGDPIGTGDVHAAAVGKVAVYSPPPFILNLHVWSRWWDRSNNKSDWVKLGPILNSASYAGSIGSQNPDDLHLTGVRTGDSGAAKKVVAEGPVNFLVVLTGGAPTETWNVPLPAGFTTKPDGPSGAVSNNSNNLMWLYDWDNPASNSSQVRIHVFTRDGTNIAPASAFRIQAKFYQNV